ncbi:unnamed protein product [Adineta steineri]|uniref:Uncharacterized protein n=1 Tax=Adineta steineri TaxID=433720 RepID=A0A815D2W1_9BILA|nr:unnamed protein product [Adineta steineri]
MTFPTHSPLVTKLLNELFQQISSKNSIQLNKYQCEIPLNSSHQLPIDHRLKLLILLQLLLKIVVEKIDILLIIRLLCPEHFINALSQYTIEQFDLNTIQINDHDFQDKGQHNVVITKDVSVNLIYLGAHLHHYDCFLEGKVSLSNLLYKKLEMLYSRTNCQDDFLHHLLESILKNNQQFSQIDILLIIRLLCLEHFINALSQYVIEQFDLNTIQINDYDFQGINIITLPNIFLLNKEYQENF